jgi:hypothetical protein
MRRPTEGGHTRREALPKGAELTVTGRKTSGWRGPEAKRRFVVFRTKGSA